MILTKYGFSIRNPIFAYKLNEFEDFTDVKFSIAVTGINKIVKYMKIVNGYLKKL